MSHTVTVKTKFKNAAGIRRACKRLKLDAPTEDTEVELFSERLPNMTAVQLKDWKYPIAINPKTGEVKYDNYEGRWGKEEQFNEFSQAYAVEVTRLQASEYGRDVQETKLKDGSIKLTVSM